MRLILILTGVTLAIALSFTTALECYGCKYKSVNGSFTDGTRVCGENLSHARNDKCPTGSGHAHCRLFWHKTDTIEVIIRSCSIEERAKVDNCVDGSLSPDPSFYNETLGRLCVCPENRCNRISPTGTASILLIVIGVASYIVL